MMNLQAFNFSKAMAELDNLSDSSALRRKLESKTEALLILTQELAACRQERDKLKKSLQQTSDTKTIEGLSVGCYSCSNQIREIKDRNRCLQAEIELLQRKLEEAQGDIKVLRREKENERLREGNCVGNWHQKEALIEQIEKSTGRIKQLESELESALDEKQELTTERDLFKAKVHRLNHELAIALKATPPIDIDSLIMENKFLSDRLEQVSAEKEMMHHSLVKYKGMLEKKKVKGNLTLGTDNPGGMIVTHRQVTELLISTTLWTTPVSEATLADLRSLCVALLESLQDKMVALTHHKKTNKILASRIAELEGKLTKDRGWTILPSKLLVQGYSEDLEQNDNQFELSQDKEGSDDRATADDIGCDDDSGLPPCLQELVMNAMKELKEEE